MTTTPADPPLPGMQLPTLELNGRTHWPEMTDLVVVGPGAVEAKRTRMTTTHLSALLAALPEEAQEALLGPFLADVVMAELAQARSALDEERADWNEARKRMWEQAKALSAERDALAAKLDLAHMCIEHVRGYLEVQRSQADILLAVRITLEEYDRALQLEAAGKGGA